MTVPGSVLPSPGSMPSPKNTSVYTSVCTHVFMDMGSRRI